MIQAKELRIGCLLCFLVKHKNGGPIKGRITTALNAAQINKLDELENTGDFWEPIELSPEILQACGFEKRKVDEDYEYWGILNFTLIYGRTDEGGFGWFLNGYHNDCHLKYLHQLQNLYFALTGTELSINLEKVKA